MPRKVFMSMDRCSFVVLYLIFKEKVIVDNLVVLFIQLSKWQSGQAVIFLAKIQGPADCKGGLKALIKCQIANKIM